MQCLLSPVARTTASLPVPQATPLSESPPFSLQPRLFLRSNCTEDFHSSLSVSSCKLLRHYVILSNRSRITLSRTPAASAYSSATSDESEKTKLFQQVSKRLLATSRHFKRLGNFGFWGQLVCTVVAAVILSFSTLINGNITAPATFYATAAGIAAAFVSVFWSFGYIRLAKKLKNTASDPFKAPSRTYVIRSIKNGIIVNLLGLGAAILGMQATVGALVAKALTTSANPFQSVAPGASPVLALDVFLVQASANTILSHFLGLSCNMELLRSVTEPEAVSVPKIA